LTGAVRVRDMRSRDADCDRLASRDDDSHEDD
jgi:hypothetical protein